MSLKDGVDPNPCLVCKRPECMTQQSIWALGKWRKRLMNPIPLTPNDIIALKALINNFEELLVKWHGKSLIVKE